MSLGTEILPQLPAGLSPDWLLEVDLPCPRCRYNLRKLRVPRCPECGGAFRWQTLLHISCPRCDASLESEEGSQCPACTLDLDWTRLFGERDPREFTQFEYTLRPVSAAIAAWLAALRPFRFWSNVRLESPPAVQRLQWLRVVALLVFAAGLAWTVLALQIVLSTAWNPLSRGDALGYLAGWIAPLLLPLVSIQLIPIFSQTLARFRTRRDQLLRIYAYGTAGLVWLGLAYLGLAAVTICLNQTATAAAAGFAMEIYPDLLTGFEWLTRGFHPSLPRTNLILSWVAVALIVAFGFLWWWRFFFVALHTYLRLRRRDVWALFLSTQLIALLSVAIMLLWLGGYRWSMIFG